MLIRPLFVVIRVLFMLFKTPWILFFLPVTAGIIFFFKRRQKISSVKFSSLSLLPSALASLKTRSLHLPFILRILTIILFFIALAGPRSVKEETIHKTEGIDIVLALDASGSMAAEDFVINGERTNRLDVIKQVVKDFINERPSDRVGLVTFGALAYTVCPLTTDHVWLKDNLERINLGVVEDGTAIGSGIASSVGRLKKSTAKSKVIILLTDGINNTGKIDPLTAAQTAKSFGIKIYTIGAGSEGYVPFPMTDFFGHKVYRQERLEIDEKTLQKIADSTFGRYFRATDTESLKQIYSEINKLEKTKIEEIGFREYKELFPYVLTAALVLLILELLLSHTLLIRVP